jgi:hypothetical protein
MSNDDKRKTKFNPRTLFLTAIKNTELGHTYTARNESNYSGGSLTARGVGYVIRPADFVAQDGVRTVALLTHKSLQNVGASNQVSLNNSMSFWVDAVTGAFRGFCVYASNYPYRPIPLLPLNVYDTMDWQVVQTPSLLAMPNTTMYADFRTTSTVWTSASVAMTPAKKVAAGTITSGNPYQYGDKFSIPGWSFSMVQSIITVPRTDTLIYRFNGTVTINGVSHDDVFDIHVSVKTGRITRFNGANDFVVVNATSTPPQFRIESMRLTRVEDSKVSTGQS